MSASRDSTPRPIPHASPGSGAGARPRSDGGPEPTESLHPGSNPGWDGPRLPVPPPAAPAMGTRDVPPPADDTRIESPNARTRTPARKSVPPPTPRPNDRVDDRVGQVLGAYRLLELIGKGGMGFVYRAEHVRLGREVALKVLRADYAKRRDAVARFFQEARTVNRIRHRNIVDVTDFIELDDGTTYIIMELLRGRSLGQWARSGGGNIELPRALALLIQICDGLAAAHAVGVIHRDLKPDNLIVVATADGAEQIKLLDFGVAKLINRDDEDVGLETAAGSVIGTPAYMSPEQAGGLVIDHRADIYSLGAIMYEMFCGQPLFRGRSFGEYVRKHLNEQPIPPRETIGGGNIDDRLEAVLMRCLQKDAGRRHQTVEDLRDDLLHLLGGIETHEHTIDPRTRGRMPLPHPRTPHGHSGSGRASRDGDHGPDSRDSRDGVGSRDSRDSRDSRGSRDGVGSLTMPPPGPDTLARLGLASGGYASQPGHGSARRDLGPAASLTGSQRGPEPRGSRAWVFAGASVALAGAAVVAVAVLTAGAAPADGPTAQPATPAMLSITPMGPTSPRAALVEVRIDASPGATVFAAGSSAALCAAPCALVIDPADGGSIDRRDFLVRKPGYLDQPFSIDLAHPPTGVPIELVPLEVATPSGRDRRERARPTVPAAMPLPEGEVVPIPTTPEPEPPAVVAEPDPTPVAPPPRKPRNDPKVDPTATMDPFAPR